VTYHQSGPAMLPDGEVVIVGNTWRLDLVLEDFDAATQVSTPFDLTGVTGVAKIREEPSGRVIATPTVGLTVAASGTWYVTLPATQTAALTPEVDLLLGVRLTWTTGEVYDVLEGRISVRRGLVS